MNSFQYSDFFGDLLNEAENNFIEFGYHYTTKDRLPSIIKDGLRVNQPIQYTIGDNEWVHRAYGMSPIFMGITPQKEYGPRTPHGSKSVDWVLLKVNVSGMNIAADLGTLIDHGAYIEEEGFWFEKNPSWLNEYEYEFTYDELQGSENLDLQRVIRATQTFVVLENIPPDKIKVVKQKGGLTKTLSNIVQNILPVTENDDIDHASALATTGFWGKQGAGCIFLAKDTKRILLPYRSSSVEQPHTWGVWGGAIDSKETPSDAVKREIREEAGYNGSAQLVPLVVFEKETFKYHNFLAIIETEFTPRLNWETEEFKWVEYGDWPSPLHFGLQYLIDKSGKDIQQIISKLK